MTSKSFVHQRVKPDVGVCKQFVVVAYVYPTMGKNMV